VALVVLLKSAFFNIPQITDAYLASGYVSGNLLYFSFLPHLVPFYHPTAPFIHQTYTIGIEEQFYFLWGLLFFLSARYVKWFFVFVLFTVPVLNFFHDFYYQTYLQSNSKGLEKYFFTTVTFIKYSRFSTFAIGSLFALAYFNNKKWINIFKLPYIQIIVYALLILSILFDFNAPYFRDEYIATLVISLFMVANFKKESIVNYDTKWLSFLGKISYGIYLFHIFAIVFAIKICTGIFHFKVNTCWELFVLVFITMLLSVLFGFLSYFTFERYFLNLKNKFRKVSSY
jgi:peptidoglycan/LPS O-acetylase OafA/YrhL